MAITPGQVIEAADVNALDKLRVAETEVFAGESPNDAWVDLDLSGTIGARASLVLLKFNCDVAVVFSVRKNGDTDEFDVADISNSCGIATLTNSTTASFFVTLVATDNAGVIEWRTSASETATIDVICYVNANA